MFDFLKPKQKHSSPMVRTLTSSATETVATIPIVAIAMDEDRGYRFSSEFIERSDDLTSVPFVECINAKLSLSPHLFVSVAIVQAAKAGKTAVLLVAPTVTTDDLTEYEEILTKQGWSLPSEGYQVWRAAPSIIIAVSQGHLGHHQISAVQSINRDSGKSALWQSFVDVAQWAFDQGANDIDYAVNIHDSMSQICFKIDGRYLKPQRWRLPTDTMLQMLGIAWQRGDGGSDATFQQRIEQQCRIEVDLANDVRVRLRWSGMAIDSGPVVTMRLQKLGASSVVKTLEGAGYLPWHLEVYNRVIATRGGMITMAGTVGSGKSVSLAILMGLLPTHIKKVSMEDPVEIDMPDVYQKTISRDLLKTGDGDDAAFSSGTRALFRSAFDTFLLGEIRDRETARVARAVLESGHSLYTTTHAPGVLGIFSRYVSPQIGIPLDVLATPGNVRLNVYQALLPRNCPHCAKSPDDYVSAFNLRGAALTDHQNYLDRFERLYGFDRNLLRLRDSNGCDQCVKPELSELNGFAGRTVAAEMLEPDEAMCDLLLSGNQVGLHRYWRELSNQKFADPDFTGKSAMDVAIYKASLGQVDPREIELQFESFASVEHKRVTRKAKSTMAAVLRTVGATT
ncbi:ATPase, T2SS/T4P/T4SS family [Limnohabitans sp.]|uniref:ATPase, T2SS/T4P/T4SS family n=1 Tax=Limnohabitans sp. TaxID=1907725 RepID=UPI00286FAB7E|nr:ATPase, T2SS/T4P/T4SS family [Limnohabitans sp.]